MKTLYTLLLIMCSFNVFAQDSITDKTGKSYSVKILSESQDQIMVRLESGQEVSYPKNALTSFAYAPGSKPEKNNNTIVIETGLSPEDAFTEWGRHLAQNGYSIANSSRDFYTLSTGPKDTSKMNYAFVLNSAVDAQGRITIKLQWQLKSSFMAGTRESNFYDWEYATAKSNVQNLIYRDLLPTLDSFGGVLSYSTR